MTKSGTLAFTSSALITDPLNFANLYMQVLQEMNREALVHVIKMIHQLFRLLSPDKLLLCL